MWSWWWALLFLIALLGWWNTKSKKNDAAFPVHRRIDPEYFKGLNYVLNEQPDKAIEVFVQMVAVDSETVETHLALGNLFRRRGEVDRALRIHQNLVARPTLSSDQRSQALFELARDYQKAGLLDRAEQLFLDVSEEDILKQPAFKNLVEIYQQEKDWMKAIAICKQLEKIEGKSTYPMIAQFYCELAEQAWQLGDDKLAGQMLKRASASDRACVRASILRGRIAQQKEDYKLAIRAYKQVEEQDNLFLPEVLDDLRFCFEKLGKPEQMNQFLSQVLPHCQGTAAMLLQANIVLQNEGVEEAGRFLANALQGKQSLVGLHQFIQIRLQASDHLECSSLATVADLLAEMIAKQPHYVCVQCGFSGKSLHWQCPGCRDWNTMKPVQSLQPFQSLQAA